MPKTLTFLHTSPVHIATFDRLLDEIAPTIPTRHIVNETLLCDARAHGLTPDLTQHIEAAVQDAFADGAALLLCTCSTIGGVAEDAETTERPVLRVDRAMAAQAVALGPRIVLAAALRSTLEPTRALLHNAAQRTGTAISIVDAVCDDAWALFEHGDHAGYIAAVAACLRVHADDGDVIVLAQASMADATRACADLAVPILSSPRLGLAAAVHAYRQIDD